ATSETGEPLHDGKAGATNSIWYTWHANFSGMMSLTTRGSSFDTIMAVYTNLDVENMTVTNLVQVAADDDGGGYLSALVIFNAVEGADYQIAVTGFNGASGNVILGLPSGEGYRV